MCQVLRAQKTSTKTTYGPWELEFHSSSHEPQLDHPVGTFSGRKNRWRTYGTPIVKTMKIDGTSMKFHGKSMEIQMENSACDLLGPL